MSSAELARRALDHYCPMCRAGRGQPCTSIVDGQPLPNRDVHEYRIRPSDRNPT